MRLGQRELKAINDKAGDVLSDATRKEKKLFVDAFRASRDDGDSIDDAIDYALEVYEDEVEALEGGR